MNVICKALTILATLTVINAQMLHQTDENNSSGDEARQLRSYSRSYSSSFGSNFASSLLSYSRYSYSFGYSGYTSYGSYLGYGYYGGYYSRRSRRNECSVPY